MTQTPQALLAEARSWIGTPYKHQAPAKVLAVIASASSAAFIVSCTTEPETPSNYAPEWADLNNADQLLSAARLYLHEVPETSPQPAQVILFRWAPHYPCKHLGLMSAHDRFIHAYEAVGVVESPLVPMWRNKIAGCFSFFPTD